MNTEAVYEMTVSPRALTEVKGKLIEDAERLKGLAAKPDSFRPIVGTYQRVSNEAIRRNEAQIRSGFLDYLYAPEPVKVAAKQIGGQS